MRYYPAKAFVAGWDASIVPAGNPYQRSDYRRAFERGRAAGKRSSDVDAAMLKRYLAELDPVNFWHWKGSK